MRILAFSDLHCSRKAAREIVVAARDADLVVGAGDFANRGIGLRDTVDLLCQMTVPTVFVAGNHDLLDELRVACANNAAIRILHGETAAIGGVTFFGLGYEIPAGLDEPWNQRLEEAQAAEILAACPPGAVLVTHSPPFGIADLQADGRHDGSRAIRDTLAAAQPRLHLCGHIHYSWGKSGAVGSCPVHNLGPTVNWFDV